MSTVFLDWAAPQSCAAEAVFPVFMPFMGCPGRCIFCAQDAQTGGGEASLTQRLAVARAALARRADRGLPPVELAFYGGTFTALPAPAQEACLAFAAEAMRAGQAVAFRCSTRPDCLSAAKVRALRESGCVCIELGIQSFADAALDLARRGYGQAVAITACELVRAGGLRLGVQLLPGMPGVDRAVFLQDVQTALSVGANMLRFYPCLVLEGTALAEQWRAGRFAPWDLPVTLDALAEGWLLAHAGGVPVIRMGLAPEASLADAVLAGPVHPALGARVLARALLLAVRRACAQYAPGKPLRGLEIPRRCQGHFWGAGGELRSAWAGLGITQERLSCGQEGQIRLIW